MKKLPKITLSGDLEGDYVVLTSRAGGVLKIAPEQPGGAPVVASLKRTSIACPSQWEGVLEDGRMVYLRYRWGQLSAGIGDDVDVAVDNSMADDALYREQIGDDLDGVMGLEELRTNLWGLLELPATLEVEGEDHGWGKS